MELAASNAFISYLSRVSILSNIESVMKVIINLWFYLFIGMVCYLVVGDAGGLGKGHEIVDCTLV